jgi:glycosyltransferase involved in cell wall biosynthesis
MQLSVIIVARNEEHTIGTQLDALVRQEWSQPWEVIVADNGSTDNTTAVVARYEEHLPHLRVLDASQRVGGAHARNIAVDAARGESIAFCDADDEVAPGWVAAMGKALEQHDFVASRFDHQKLNPASERAYGLTIQTSGVGKLWYPPHMYHASTSGMGIKTAIYKEVGGFDAHLQRLADTDFCIRVQRAGTHLHFVPEAVVAYRHRNEGGAMFRQGRLWAKHNAMTYARYRPEGARIPFAWSDYLYDWLPVLGMLPLSVRASTRAQLIYKIGWQVGMLQGSLIYKVEPPVVPRPTLFRRVRRRLIAAWRKLLSQQQPTGHEPTSH